MEEQMTEEYAKRLLDPEDLGYAVGPIDRDKARIRLGIKPVESYLACDYLERKRGKGK